MTLPAHFLIERMPNNNRSRELSQPNASINQPLRQPVFCTAVQRVVSLKLLGAVETALPLKRVSELGRDFSLHCNSEPLRCSAWRIISRAK